VERGPRGAARGGPGLRVHWMEAVRRKAFAQEKARGVRGARSRPAPGERAEEAEAPLDRRARRIP